MIFDPFENRHHRDIRNALGSGFVKSIQQRTLRPFQSALDTYPNQLDKSPTGIYIENRHQVLKKMLNQIESTEACIMDDFSILMLLWDHQLYYEFHEWVEEIWLTAKGDFKKALQALIFVSVAFEQHLYNRNDPAKRLALKAIDRLNKHKFFLPNSIKASIFIDALKKI